jgi:precorrin-6B methylase 2
MGLFRRAISAFRENGFKYVLFEAFPHIHNHYIREHLWRKETTLNGITVKSKRVGDNIVPWQSGHPEPDDYENGIIRNLRKYVEEGDCLIIVGGGWGVSTTVAASLVGPNGNVVSYEASPKQAQYTRETVALNGVSKRVQITNSVVSHAVSMYGSGISAHKTPPEEIPECDVLELDCEGAETNIIENMTIRPRVVIVESHGIFDSPTEEVWEALRSAGYNIESTELAEVGEYKEMCEERDVRVVVGTRNEN